MITLIDALTSIIVAMMIVMVVTILRASAVAIVSAWLVSAVSIAQAAGLGG